VQGTVNGRKAAVGSEKMMQDASIDTAPASNAILRFSEQGKTPILVSVDGKLTGIIAVADTLHPASKEAAAELKEMGFELVLLTGDNSRTAHAIAAQAGIDKVFAEVLPQEKAAKIRELQCTREDRGNGRRRYERRAFAGAGGCRHCRRNRHGYRYGNGGYYFDEIRSQRSSSGNTTFPADYAHVIKQNLFWAFVYNSIGIPLAAMGIAQSDVCRRSDGIELRERGDELAEAARSEVVSCSNHFS
jgi:Cu+-exporting ATPase